MNIYKMKLHESAWVEDVGKSVLRVPGGWIYGDWDTERDQPIEGGTFVPFNNEFMECSEQAESPSDSSASPVQHTQAKIVCPSCKNIMFRKVITEEEICSRCNTRFQPTSAMR